MLPPAPSFRLPGAGGYPPRYGRESPVAGRPSVYDATARSSPSMGRRLAGGNGRPLGGGGRAGAPCGTRTHNHPPTPAPPRPPPPPPRPPRPPAGGSAAP